MARSDATNSRRRNKRSVVAGWFMSYQGCDKLIYRYARPMYHRGFEIPSIVHGETQQYMEDFGVATLRYADSMTNYSVPREMIVGEQSPTERYRGTR